MCKRVAGATVRHLIQANYFIIFCTRKERSHFCSTYSFGKLLNDVKSSKFSAFFFFYHVKKMCVMGHTFHEFIYNWEKYIF